MNAKQLALVIAFAALAIALNAIRIPAFFFGLELELGFLLVF